MGRADEILLRLRTQGRQATEGDLLAVARASGRVGDRIDHVGDQARRSVRSFTALRASSRGVTGSFGLVARGAGAAAAAVGGIYAVGSGLKFAFDEASEAAKVGAQTAAVIRSTGGAANVTAGQIGDLAGAISAYAGIDDEAIQSGANFLLTFTGVRNEVGKGNDVFNQAVATMTDMSVALGQDARQSALQLGKALNDPIAGVSALRRVGVSFTEQQKREIAALVARGRTLDAQKLILRELAKEFGGSARAGAQPIDKLKVSIGNLAETVGTILLPFVNRAIGPVTRFLNQLNDSGEIERGMAGLKVAVRDVSDTVTDWLIPAGRETIAWLKDLPGPAKAAGAAVGAALILATGGTLAIVAAVVAGVTLAHKHWDEISEAAGRFADQVGLTSARTRQAMADIGTIVQKLRPIFAAVFEHGILPGVKHTIDGIVQAFTGTATMIGGVVKLISGILTGDFGKAWDGVKQIFSGGAQAILGSIRVVTGPARGALEGIWTGLASVAGGAWRAVKAIVEDGVNFLIGKVRDLLTVYNDIPDIFKPGGDIPLPNFIGERGAQQHIADSTAAGSKLTTPANRALTTRQRGGTLKDLLSGSAPVRGPLAGSSSRKELRIVAEIDRRAVGRAVVRNDEIEAAFG